jgi:tetratricopeptide (TPR) repeat protein
MAPVLGGAGAALHATREGAAGHARRAATHETAVREADIAFYQARVRRDPQGAADLARLGSLHLASARATGSADDLQEAEAVARRSLAHRRAHNHVAALVLANALMGQHRFAEALDATAGLADDEDPAITSLVGEILLELGRYQEAATSFARIGATTDLTILMRLARFHEVTGAVERAGREIALAHELSRGMYALPLEQGAWFALREAEFALRYGFLRTADRALTRGFQLSPDDHRLHTVAARLALTRRHWDRAAWHAGEALATAFDPGTLALLAAAEQGRGDGVAARQAMDALELAVAAQPAPWHRAWSLALLDGGRHVGSILAQAEADIEIRPDAYGWDLLAWARYRHGNVEGARSAMRRALASGLRDPDVLAHAAAIGAGTS